MQAASVELLKVNKFYGPFQALKHLVRPASGSLQTFSKRGLTHAAPAGAVGICR